MSKKTRNKVFAVIDIGAHSMRLEIAQTDKSGGFKILETLSQNIPIGRDVFSKGFIKPENFTLASKILKDFALLMKDYGVSSYRAVATSAVREALNKDIFVDRVFHDSGIRIETLDSSEEIRLIYLSLKKVIRGKIDDALIAMIGTGASHICLLRGGVLKKAESFRMGTLRIYEELGQPISKSAVVLDDIVDSVVDLLLRAFSELPRSLVAVGSTPRSLLKISHKISSSDRDIISFAEFYSILKIVELNSPEKLANDFKISDIDAVGLLPCCDILSNLLKASGADSIFVPDTNTREAILEQMMRSSKIDDPFEQEIISCSHFLGEKFAYDKKHAEAVSKYSLKIFDRMKSIHGLGRKERLLLHVAAILHDVGQFLNNRQHHKHSYYLIRNSQIPGLGENDVNLAAVVARYHRRGSPKKSHQEYIQLDSTERVVVSKLAAILRVADALDRSHNAKFENFEIKIEPGKMIICPDAMAMDLAAEVMALKSKSDLFNDIYGIKVEFL